MKTLYLHNYKGFVKTFIPFTDINFFVGENSTGKTAVLNLLGIISEFRFWIMSDFNNDSIELGYFNEIVNQNAKDKSAFEVGLELDKPIKNMADPRYFWLKFKERDNIPFVKEYRYVVGKQSITVSIATRSVKYWIDKYSDESFEEWINKGKTSHTMAKKISLPESNLPFGIIRSMVETKLTENNEIEIFSDIDPLISRVLWIEPIRAKAKRYYEMYKTFLPFEEQHTPIVLKDIFSEKNREKSSKIVSELLKFGRNSHLFDEIEIKEFNKESDSPFSINIHYDSLSVRITNVGYGVAQILPIVVDVLATKRSRLAIQQPEVHLHPRAQAAFGDLLYYSANENKNTFYVETHSDFTINRFRMNLFNSNDSKKVTGQVLFFERTKNGTKVTPILFNQSGQYPEGMPESYSKFFIDEELKLLEF